MPRFEYVAKRDPGDVVQGVMEADSERAVVARLSQMGCHPCSISQWRERTSMNVVDRLRYRRIRPPDLSLFTRQLSDLIDAGMTVSLALFTVAEQSENPRLREVVRSVHSEVAGGKSLAAALAGHPRIFPELMSTMVRAGEEGGTLPEVLAGLAEHYERSQELSGKVKAALAYPVFLVFVGSATVFVLMSFVVPRFVDLFAGFGADLPLPTRVLIRVSTFLGAFWWALLLGVLGAVILVRRVSKGGRGKSTFDRIKLAVPLLGPVLSKVDIARFTRTLGTLLENGVPILQALEIAGQTVSNTHIRSPIVAVSAAVRDGKGMAEPLESSPYFPPTVTNLIVIGYASGNLPGMLNKIASIYDREVERATQVMTRLLEPALIFVLGGVVGLIVAGILLPIFRVNVLVR